MPASDLRGDDQSIRTMSPQRLPLFALFAANAVSMVGNQITLLAVPWFVLTTGGTATDLGLVGFFTILPMIISAFLGGTVVDRLGHKRTSVVADLCSGGAVALIPLLHGTVGLAFWQLLGLVFLGALLDAPGSTARQSLLPEMITISGMPPERANAAYQTIQRFSQLLGPLLAGLLIATLGATNVMWIDAGTFLVSALTIVVLLPRSAASIAARTRYLDDLLEGLQFIRSDRLLLWLAGLVAVLNFLDAPISAVIMPVFAREAFGGAEALGIMFAAFGAGAVIGGIVYGAVGHRLPRREVFIGAFVLAGLPFFVLAAAPPLGITVGALFVSGLGAGPLNPILMTVRQKRVPMQLRGRVFGTLTALAFIGMPVGMVAGGLLLDTVGLRLSWIAIATAYLAVTLSMLLNQTLREMDRRSES